MELGERKLKILRAIIDDYILTAMPVGSRTVSRKYLEWSSATIRNEMSDLEEMGYLEQPHASAGRVPSDMAYRLYVDQLMSVPKLTHQEIESLHKHVGNRLDQMQEVFRHTAKALAEATQYTAMVLPPQAQAVRLRSLQLVPVADGVALLVLVTSAGLMKDALLRVPEQVDPDHLYRISRLLTDHLEGMTLMEASQALQRQQFMQQDQEFLSEVLSALKASMIATDARQDIILDGTSKILNYPEYSDLDKARHFLSVLETKDLLYNLLQNTNLEFSIHIGRENLAQELQDCSIITATYRVGNETLGSMGVIGPTRMQYSRVMAVLGVLGKSLGEILSELPGAGGNQGPPKLDGPPK